MLRELKNAGMWLQHNKVASLQGALSCLDGLIVNPGGTFPFWRLARKPTAAMCFRMQAAGNRCDAATGESRGADFLGGNYATMMYQPFLEQSRT